MSNTNYYSLVPSVCHALWHSVAAAQSGDTQLAGGRWRLFAAQSERPVILFSGAADTHCRYTLNVVEDALLFWFIVDGEVMLTAADASPLRMTGYSANLVRLNRGSGEVCIKATAGTAIVLLEIPPQRLSELLTPGQCAAFAGNADNLACDVSKQQMTAGMYSAVQNLVGESFPPSLSDLFVASRADELIARFLKNQLSPEHTANDSNLPPDISGRIQQARQILLDNYLAPPTLEQLARKVGINRNKLCRGFRQLFGVTVFEYCHRHRMQMARTLLRENNLSIAHVAEAAGYEHPGNFTAAYKRHYGELPKAAKQYSRPHTV